MTPEEIKAAEEKLKKEQEALAAAKKEFEAQEAKKKEQQSALDKFPKEAQEMIKELRKENAERRTKAKELEESLKKTSGEVTSFKSQIAKAFGVEDEQNLKPEDKVAELLKKNEQLEYERGITTLAYKYDIKSDQLKYFEFLVMQATQSLRDGEELPEQALQKIADDVKSVSGTKEKATSTVDGGKEADSNPGAKVDENVSLDDFRGMNIIEKSMLYEKSPETYNKLKKELLDSGGSLIN